MPAHRRFLCLCLALAALLLATAPASADRFVDPGGPTFLAVDNEIAAFAGFAYFAANDGVVGAELWRTDGTAAGTTLVADFKPGAANQSGNPRNFRVVGNRLYFNASNPTDGDLVVYYIEPGGAPVKASFGGGSGGSGVANGPLLGEVNGKVLLRQLVNGNGYYGLYALGATGSTFTMISPGGNNVGGEEVATLGNKAFFDSATGANSATEPWVTDGTAGGTALLKDIYPNAGGVNNGSGPQSFIATSDRVYFIADDGTRGDELWGSDGTSAGTQLVYEHHPLVTGTSFFDDAVVNGSTLYYLPNDPGTGQEVWRTNGTAASTRVVDDITPGPAGSGQTNLFAFRSGFGMLRGSDVYYYDGSSAATVKVGSVDGDGNGPGAPYVAGERTYFRGGFSPFGAVVWRTDGTPAGTFALTAGAFEGRAGGSPFAGPFVQLGSKIIFVGRFPVPAGSPIFLDSERIYVIDTAQPDETRQATAAPTIAGTPAVGQKLTANRGSWTREPNQYTYQWLRNGTPINNANGLEYTPSSGDAGTLISFRVSARGTGLPNLVTADSPAVAVGGTIPPPPAAPRPTPPSTTPPPRTTPPGTTTPPARKRSLTVRRTIKLTGEARVGKRLKLRTPSFAQSGVKLTIRWYANGIRITGQSKSSLTLRDAVRSKRITVRVTATKSGYTTRTLTAGPTAKVKRRAR